ncbi:putative TetR family transcriptional regulator [Actinacidiphila reveromycinica]|uniref:Putative TetR family transcriptional regulator n=1 Tax=Actinacidiphila reveromycinica TaxID=659352 RepID=A0A7U3USK4_9ACTN|nr:TetR family transcriptional regulator [Streptomyces sp. SN-593]BBA98017.1 putative TetR family transcriptional regulator [Streptomyces sp. SN-593]
MGDGPARRGRRPGAADTRGAVLAAARRLFLEHGYEAVTLRAIAADAGVDAALISYYFGSKRGLFGASMALVANPAEVLVRVLDGDPATLSLRALRAMLAIWDAEETGPALVAMVRNVMTEESFAVLVKEMLEREVVEKLADRVGGPQAHARAMAFCSQIAGIIMTRYLLALEPIASMPVEDVVRHCGPSLRLALHGRPGIRQERRMRRPDR